MAQSPAAPAPMTHTFTTEFPGMALKECVTMYPTSSPMSKTVFPQLIRGDPEKSKTGFSFIMKNYEKRFELFMYLRSTDNDHFSGQDTVLVETTVLLNK